MKSVNTKNLFFYFLEFCLGQCNCLLLRADMEYTKLSMRKYTFTDLNHLFMKRVNETVYEKTELLWLRFNITCVNIVDFIIIA
jgi:hypothetical protein